MDAMLSKLAAQVAVIILNYVFSMEGVLHLCRETGTAWGLGLHLKCLALP